MAETTLLERLRACEILTPEKLDALAPLPEAASPDPRALGKVLLQRGWLTRYQINQVASGRGKELLVGPYVLREKLGEGGMGQVFEATHRHMGRVVALKLIRKEKLDSPDAVARFYQEVRAAASLVHPNIVVAYDAGQAGTAHFFSMEFIAGPDLSRVVREGGRLPVATACDYIAQAARGLQHAHEVGLVHRDIKPANLLAAPGPGGKVTVKILDMGLARLGDNFEKERSLTAAGAVIGTPDYLAPEQAMDARNVDTRADVYSLGCSLFFLLTGRAPFQAGSLAELFMKHQMEAPPSVREERPDVPEAIDRLIRRMMAKKPDDRPATPGEAAEALESAAAGGTDQTLDEEPRPTPKRRRPAFDKTEEMERPKRAKRPKAVPAVNWPLWAGVGGVGLVAVIAVIAVIAMNASRRPGETAKGPPVVVPPVVVPPVVVPTMKDAVVKPPPVVEPPAKDAPGGPPIDFGEAVELVRGAAVPGRVAAFLDDASAVTINGTLVKRRRVPDGKEQANYEGHAAAVRAVALSRDGKRMASSDEGKRVLIWDVPGAQVLKEIHAREVIRSLAFSPDGRRLAGGGSPAVFVWDWDVGDAVREYAGKRSGEFILKVAFSEDGTRVVSGGQTFRVWDTKANTTPVESGPLGGAMGFAGSKDAGTFYLATSYAYLFHKTPGNLRKLKEVGFTLFDVAYTPDRRRLLVGGAGAVGVADPETGELTARLDLPGQAWNVVASPNGRYLAASGRDREESHFVAVRPKP